MSDERKKFTVEHLRRKKLSANDLPGKKATQVAVPSSSPPSEAERGPLPLALPAVPNPSSLKIAPETLRLVPSNSPISASSSASDATGAAAEFIKVSIDSIDPNPYRDLKLFPPDPDRVKSLKASYAEHGDTAVLSVRKKPGMPGRYELAYGGHQRLEVQRQRKDKLVDIKILALSDSQMLMAMIAENAGNVAPRMGVIVEAILAIVTVEAVRILSSKKLENASDRKMLASLLAGDGIGEPAVSRILTGLYSVPQVREAVAIIKESELHAVCAKRITERIRANFPEDNSEPRRRAKQMLAKMQRVTPTLTSAEVLKLEKASHSQAVRLRLKKEHKALLEKVLNQPPVSNSRTETKGKRSSKIVSTKEKHHTEEDRLRKCTDDLCGELKRFCEKGGDVQFVDQVVATVSAVSKRVQNVLLEVKKRASSST